MDGVKWGLCPAADYINGCIALWGSATVMAVVFAGLEHKFPPLKF